MKHAKEIAGRFRDKAVQTSPTADEAVHEHPYKALNA
jgi:hypothetical protein